MAQDQKGDIKSGAGLGILVDLAELRVTGLGSPIPDWPD